MEPVGFGVLGARSLIATRAVIPALRRAAGCRLVAVASSTGPVPDAVADLDAGGYDALLAHPAVEAVYIPLPNAMHREWVERAAAAGKHVLCEKPLAPTAVEAAAMAATCAEAGVLLAEAWMTPFQPRWAEVMNMARTGVIGDVRHVRAEFTFPLERPAVNQLPWRLTDGGGALLDIGIYCLGPAVELWDAEPATVAASIVRHPSGVDLTTSAWCDWPGGRSASAICSFEMPERQWLELTGTAGRLIVDHEAHTGGLSTVHITRQGPDGVELTVRAEPGDSYEGMVAAFARAVRGEAPWPRPVDRSIALARLFDRILSTS